MFQMTPAGALTTLVSFNGDNGSNPYGGLTEGNDHNFYGTTYDGGVYNLGTVFQMTSVGALTTLVSFNGTNGRNPLAALVQGGDGNFYGTTESDNANTNGTVFKIALPARRRLSSGSTAPMAVSREPRLVQRQR